MYKLFYLICFTLIGLNSCSSNAALNESSNQDKNGDVEVKANRSVLWRIDKENMPSSYLFGTMHMINKEYFHFSARLTERIVNSEAIIMEVGGMPNPIAAFNMMTIDSGTVHQFFTSDQLKELLEFMDIQMGVSPQEFDQTYGQMKPFFILQSLSQAYFEPSAESYDLQIMGLAHEQEIPLIGLETIEEQLSFFDSIPSAEISNMIIESTRNFEKEKKSAIELMEFYSKQKVDKLIPLLEKQSPEFMAYDDLFLYDRNERWIPKIEQEIKNKSCFIAVGAGHLFGDRGVIELLKAKGYHLTPISTQ